MLYLDDFFLSPVSRKQAVTALRAFVKDSVPDGTEVSLVTFDRKGLTVRVPFTTNRLRIASALNDLPVESVEGFRRVADRESTLGSIRDTQRSRLEAQKQASETPDGSGQSLAVEYQPPCGLDLLEWARAYASTEFTDAQRSIHALRLFLDSLAPIPGRKTLIHVSDGIPLHGGAEAFDLLRSFCDGSGARQGLPGGTEVRPGASGAGPDGDTSGNPERATRIDPAMLASAEADYDVIATVREVTSRANTQGTTLYTLQATGLAAATQGSASRDFRSSTPEIDQAARANLQDTLSSLAVDTGGTAILGRNDFGPALETVNRDREHSYSLAFEPPERSGRGSSTRPHAVTIETTRPGVDLRYRKSYLDEAPSGDVGARLLAALFHGAAENPLGLELELKAAPRGAQGDGLEPENRWIARLSVPVASLAVLADASGVLRSGLLAVHMVMQDDLGISPLRRKEVPLRLPLAPVGAAAEPPYVYEVRFTRPAGKVTVAIALEDIVGRKVAVVRRGA